MEWYKLSYDILLSIRACHALEKKVGEWGYTHAYSYITFNGGGYKSIRISIKPMLMILGFALLDYQILIGTIHAVSAFS